MARILTLGIETSNPSAANGRAGVAIGVCQEGAVEILGVELLEPTGRHDDDLMPAIDRLTRQHGIKPFDLGRVAVSVGPGGYTGLRIAVAIAKMIALNAKASCVAVPTAHVLAARTQNPGGKFGIALASKGQMAHITLFTVDGTPEDNGKLASAADIQRLEMTTLVADQFLPDSIRSTCQELGISVIEPTFDPAACVEVSARLDAISPAELEPFYAREPDAVTNWRRLHGKTDLG